VNVTDLKGRSAIRLSRTPRCSRAGAAGAALGSIGARDARSRAALSWLQTRLPLEEVSSVSGSADVALNRLALRFDKPEAADFDASYARAT
jgi:hypothetical protein